MGIEIEILLHKRPWIYKSVMHLQEIVFFSAAQLLQLLFTETKAICFGGKKQQALF